MKLFSFLPAIVSFFSLVSASLEPVEELNLSQYDGVWYEVYGDRVDRSFQGYATCITATYTVNKDSGNVSVVNREVRQDGTPESIEGYAYYEGNNTGGLLTVSLDGTPVPAPYWVVDLGPVVEDEYDYAVVTDDKQLTLFVLARNVTTFFELYDDEVMDTLVEMGFTQKFNEPVLIEQFTECVYSDDVYDDDASETA